MCGIYVCVIAHFYQLLWIFTTFTLVFYLLCAAFTAVIKTYVLYFGTCSTVLWRPSLFIANMCTAHFYDPV